MGLFDSRIDVYIHWDNPMEGLILSKLNQLSQDIKEFRMAQELELQQIQTLLNDVVAPGVTEIITRLNNIPVDNPAIQDEIDGIRSAAQGIADQINVVLNPPPPTP